MPVPLRDLFEQYRATNDNEPWRNRYKAASSQIAEIRDGRQQLTPDFVKQIWTAAKFGPASVSQGVVPVAEFLRQEKLLTEITEAIIKDPSPAALSTAYAKFDQAKAAGILSWKPLAVTRRLMAAAAPRRYSTIVAWNYHRPLQVWLQKEYELEISGEKNDWAEMDSAMRAALVEQGLPDTDPFLLNAFIWELAYRYAPASSSDNGLEPDNGHEETPMGLVDMPLALNTIFYGPPGTGKTRKANEILKTHFTTRGEEITQTEWEDSLVRNAQWREVITAVLHDLGGKGTVPSMRQHSLMKAMARCTPARSASRNLNQIIWNSLQTYSPVDSTTVKVSVKRLPTLFDKLDDGASTWILLPGWKEESPDALALAEQYKKGRPAVVAKEPRYKSVTFHQSYSYEDFVEGIRPVLDDEENESGLSYLLRDGIFKQLCTEARRDPERNYALLIDEINRGNLTKIFGELISLIEKNKREGAEEAMSVSLPYSNESFSIPKNLYIIGTMNTADRSLALMDIALRRRFSFERVDPEPELLQGKEIQGIQLDRLLGVINERLVALYDEEHTIGHSYFMKIDDITGLQQVFQNEIIPLLKEYFFDDWEKIRLVLGDTQKTAKGKGEHCFLMRKENSDQLFGGTALSLRLAPHWIENTEALANRTAYIAIYDIASLDKE